MIQVQPSTEVNLEIGRRLRRRRRLLKLSQEEVASLLTERFGLSIRFQQIQKYESAANKMNAERLWQLATVLGVEVAHFYPPVPATLAQAA